MVIPYRRGEVAKQQSRASFKRVLILYFIQEHETSTRALDQRRVFAGQHIDTELLQGYRASTKCTPASKDITTYTIDHTRSSTAPDSNYTRISVWSLDSPTCCLGVNVSNMCTHRRSHDKLNRAKRARRMATTLLLTAAS